MKIFRYIGNISDLRKSTRDKQRSINVSEVFHLWNHLNQRYSVISVTDTLGSFIRDSDLKLVFDTGKKVLSKNVAVLEKELVKYGIPLPGRPPKQVDVTETIEQVTDRYAYRRVLRGMQAFLPTHTMALIHSTSPDIRELFIQFLTEEIKLYDKFIEYGKMKGYLIMPPLYRV